MFSTMNTLRLCVRTIVANKGLRCINLEDRRYIKRWVSPTMKFWTKQKKLMGPQPEQKRSNFIEWNRESELYAFNKRLSENFEPGKLDQALVHRSYILHEQHKQRELGIQDPKLELLDNEHLVRKGEEIIFLVVEEYLRQSLPLMPKEGIMTFQDYLLSEEMLAKASLHIGTKDLILSEEYPPSQETLAKTFIALVGALTESVDENHAAIFVRDFLIAVLADKDLTEIWHPSNPVDMLNDILLKSNKECVEPRIIGQAGINTLLASYHIGLYSNKELVSTGFGQTIEEAIEVAALTALYRMFGLLDSSQPIRFDKQLNISSA